MSEDRADDAAGETAGETAGVVVRPPLLAVGALGLALMIDALRPLPLASAGVVLDPVLRLALGAAVIGLGLLLAGWAVGRFRAAGTDVPTWKPSSALVEQGPYRWSRNPIYAGMLAILAGLGVMINSLWLLGMLLPVWAVLRYGVIAREERYLERLFGADYRRYKARVRRWI